MRRSYKRNRSGQRVKRRRVRSSNLRRAKLYRMARGCIPEIKHKSTFIQGDVKTLSVASTTLPSGYYSSFNAFWPEVGTQDTNRLGDAINIRKMWFKFVLENDTSPTSNLIRVIFFTYPGADPNGTDITGFFKYSFQQPSINSQVEREKFNVLYDRTFACNTLVTGQRRVVGPFNFNYKPKKFRKPMQFQYGTNVPKYPNDTIYVAFMGYEPGVTANSVIGYYNITGSLYFTD